MRVSDSEKKDEAFKSFNGYIPKLCLNQKAAQERRHAGSFPISEKP
jgi:hypothetical protein